MYLHRHNGKVLFAIVPHLSIPHSSIHKWCPAVIKGHRREENLLDLTSLPIPPELPSQRELGPRQVSCHSTKLSHSSLDLPLPFYLETRNSNR